MPREVVSITAILADKMSKPLTVIGRGLIALKGKAKDAQRKLEPLSRVVSRLGTALQKNSKNIQAFGRRMSIFGLAVVASLGLVGKAGAEFEAQMANVNTMLEKQTEHYLPRYAEQVKKLSMEIGESTKSLTKGLYDILSASVDASVAMDVLEVSTKAARAGLTDTGVAADAITTVLNAYGWSAERAGEVSDKLFAIVKRGKTTFGELAPNIGKVATLAASAGLSFEELGAAISTLTRAGISTEETMTAVRSVITNFLMPTDDAIKAAAELGIELNTATLRGEGLISVFKKLAGASAEQVAAIAPNVRAMVGLTGILQQTEGFEKDLQLQLNATGLTQEAFAKNTDTAAFAIDQMKAALQIARIEIGSALAPVIKDLSISIIEFVKNLREWIKENPELLKTIIKVIAKLGLFMVTVGPIIFMVGKLIAVWGLLAKAAIALKISALALVGPFAAVGVVLIGTAILASKYKAKLIEVTETQKKTNKVISETVDIIKRSNEAWKEYASVVEDSNERMTHAIKKANIERLIVDTQRRLIEAQEAYRKYSSELIGSTETRDELAKARNDLENALRMQQEALKDLTASWKGYVILKKKREAELDKPIKIIPLTEEMKEEFFQIENELLALREGQYAADLDALDKWFSDRTKLFRNNTGALVAISELYHRRRFELGKKEAKEIVKNLREEQKAMQSAIETQNELAKSGVISFGSAQAKNREELTKLNTKIDESKQKVKELFTDFPELADEFLNKISDMSISFQKVEDDISNVFTGFEAGMRNSADGMVQWADLGIQAGEMVADSISSNVSDAFVEAIRGTKDFGDAMKEMTASMLADLAKLIIRTIILRAIMSTIGGGFGGGGLVSAGMARGGRIPGPGIDRDIVPTMLTPGEFVHKRQAVDHYGLGIMDALNRMLIPKSMFSLSAGRLSDVNDSRSFAAGGQVSASGSQSPTPAYIVADEQSLDRLLAGGTSAMTDWMESNKGRVRSILGL
jgi:TP901 family phage tail tape measure protein